MDNAKLVKQFEQHKDISEGGLAEQHNRAETAHRYHAGDKALYQQKGFDKNSRSSVMFNKVKPFIDAVNGFMLQLRRKPDYQARIPDNEQQVAYTSYANSISDYIRANGNFPSLEGQQNREMLITGYGAIDTNVLYEFNPDGEVRGELVRFNDVFWDPQSQERNLLDARWVYRRKAYSLDEALARFKGSTEDDFESYQGDENEHYQYNPQGGVYNKIAQGGGIQEPLVQVNYYQYWKLEPYFRAQNPIYELQEFDPQQALFVAEMMREVVDNRKDFSDEDVDDVFEFDPMDEYLVMDKQIKSDMSALFKRLGVKFETQSYYKRVYYTAILSGDTVFSHFKSPDQNGFTIKFKTAFYDPNNRLWYGMVAGLQEPANYANKALSEILYVIASNSKGGVMYERSAIQDKRKFEADYLANNSAVAVEDGALQAGRIQPKAQPALPTGYESIYSVSNESMEQVSGISREFLGTAANSQVSALLESQRINQVIASLADYFDAIDLYQKEHARMMLTFMKQIAENSTGRLVSIIGADGARRYAELSADNMADEYDIEIGEAPTTPQQKAETAKVALDLADKLFQAGQNIYPFVIEYIPGLKQADKAKMKQAMLPSPEDIQAQQQSAAAEAEAQRAMQQVMMQSQQAQMEKTIANTQETMAKIEKMRKEQDQIAAETAKTLEEARRTSLETAVVSEAPISRDNVSVSI